MDLWILLYLWRDNNEQKIVMKTQPWREIEAKTSVNPEGDREKWEGGLEQEIKVFGVYSALDRGPGLAASYRPGSHFFCFWIR